MIRKKIKNSSIASKLLVSIITIFAVMMLLASYLLVEKQAQMMQEVEAQIEETLVEFQEKDHTTLIINESEVHKTDEYRLFSGYVIAGTILIGGVVFILVILWILRPLKELTEKTNRIDINNLSEIKSDILLESGSYELRELSQSFQNVLDKIDEDYEKQKRFSTNVAHELRTPLAVLLAKIDVFKRRPIARNPEVKSFVEVLEGNMNRLSKLVEDILLLSRDCPPKCTSVSVKELAEEVLFDLEEKAERKKIRLSFFGTKGILCTDDVLLERVIYNLVDNAIKYTQAEGECVIIITESEADVKIRVADNGPGIPDAQKKLVFNLFYRAEESRNRETGGSGVGLAIVWDAVQKLGGTVAVYDRKPSGCVFEIVLPRKLPKKE